MPEIFCLVLARPTKSLGLYLQMVGRVLRPAAGKTEALIIDHAGAVYEHGLPDDPITWTLRPDRRAVNEAQRRRSEGQMPSLVDCPECHAIRFQGKPCGVCGWKPKAKAKAVEFVDGDLGEVARDRKVAAYNASLDQKREWHAMLAWIGEEKGYRRGWAAHKFKDKFGSFPVDRFIDPAPPTPEVRSWVKSRQIAYAKAIARGAA